MAAITPNTSTEYPCLMCGTNGNIIRESQVDSEKRIKCNDLRCGFVYSAKDSLDAKKAGLVPDGPKPEPEVAEDGEGNVEHPPSDLDRAPLRQTAPPGPSITKAPRTPSFVILSKDRVESEFCTKKNLKERVIQWTASSKKFDVFELTPKKVQAKLSIQ